MNLLGEKWSHIDLERTSKTHGIFDEGTTLDRSILLDPPAPALVAPKYEFSKLENGPGDGRVFWTTNKGSKTMEKQKKDLVIDKANFKLYKLCKTS